MALKRILQSLRPPGELPEHVTAAIKRQETDSEILVGWIQLAVIITFSSLYAVAPQPFSVESEFRPVPYVLATYFVFTVVRLWLSYRISLPGWLVALSVVADIALLMVTIWSFHLQYMQPPSFYLKAPTVLYLFIFIALRALRFDVRYIVLAGLVGALGWISLVAYVISSDPTDPMITRDYVEYMTSNAILIGAEMDKVIAVLVVTGILTVAILRARALLVRSVTVEASTRSLSRFFPDAVARRIASADDGLAPGHGTRCHAAILMTDIRSFTPLAQNMDPDALIELLTEYQSRLVPVISAHGGSIDKFLGDGILATFGAVEESEAYAAGALGAVDAIMDECDKWNAERMARGEAPIGVGAGVAAGEVTSGIIGNPRRMEYTVLGNPVNLAAKLESHTKIEGVRALTDQDTFDLAQAQGYRPARECEARSDCRVAGTPEPLDLVVLRQP